MFLGWYDPGKNKTSRQKLDEAVVHYRQKFNAEPELALVNGRAKDEIGADPPIPVESAPYIPLHTFYVGVKDEEA